MTLYKKFSDQFQEMYFSHATAGILASSCQGSVAAMFILESGHGLWQMIQLFVVVVLCMGYNASVLANLKVKIVINLLLGSLFTSGAFILYYVLF